jgi:hypothetical protein
MPIHDRVGPGELTPLEADTLTELIQQFRILQSRVDAMRPAGPELLPVLLFDFDEDSGIYSWLEQTWDDQGVRVDKDNGMTGDVDHWPAFAINNEDFGVTPTTPVQAFIRQSSVISAADDDPSRGMAWEIVGIATGAVGGTLSASLSGCSLHIKSGGVDITGSPISITDCLSSLCQTISVPTGCDDDGNLTFTDIDVLGCPT